MATNIQPHETLRQSYLRSTRQQPPKSQPTPTHKVVTRDPLEQWAGRDVMVTFVSGGTLAGRLVEVSRYEFRLEDPEGLLHHVLKHAVERIVRVTSGKAVPDEAQAVGEAR